ncbi:hypothetical protein NBRC116493_04970 [Aurantivibrio infirmus]
MLLESNEKFTPENRTEEKICLLYDRQCPVCRYFADTYELTNDHIELVNAREQSAILKRAADRNFDVNNGIVLVVGESFYFAEDAMVQLVNRQHFPGPIGFVIGRIFKYPRLAKLVNPILVFLRKILLKLLGKQQISKNTVYRNANTKFEKSELNNERA